MCFHPNGPATPLGGGQKFGFLCCFLYSLCLSVWLCFLFFWLCSCLLFKQAGAGFVKGNLCTIENHLTKGDLYTDATRRSFVSDDQTGSTEKRSKWVRTQTVSAPRTETTSFSELNSQWKHSLSKQDRIKQNKTKHWRLWVQKCRLDDELICSLSHSKPSSLMPDLVSPAVCLLIQSLVNVTQGDEYCDMFSLCSEYHMSLEGFWGWNYRFQTRGLERAHTQTQSNTPHPSFWCKMPAPLNRRRNPPRFSGLPLSTLLPAEEAGDIYHKPRDDVTHVPTAVGVKVMSRMGAKSPKSLLLWHLMKTKCSQFPATLSCAVFAPLKENICWCPRAANHPDVSRSANCQFALKLSPTGDTKFLQDILTHRSGAQRMT